MKDFKMIEEMVDLVQQIKNKIEIMIKLNMKRIAELEKKNMGNQIYLNTLQQMVDLIMMPSDPMGLSNESAVNLATTTLKDLKVIDDDREVKKPVEQLNS